MASSLLSIIGSIAIVVLIAVATRWVSGAKGAQFPKHRDSASIYGIKWQWRAVGFTGGAFAVVVAVWSWHDLHRSDWGPIAISVTFMILSLWLAIGSVTTNQSGINKKSLWHSQSFQWKDITEVRLIKKQGGAIELHSGAEKIVIDSRFNAFQHLLNEIEDHTHRHPSPTS